MTRGYKMATQMNEGLLFYDADRLTPKQAQILDRWCRPNLPKFIATASYLETLAVNIDPPWPAGSVVQGPDIYTHLSYLAGYAWLQSLRMPWTPA